MERIRARARARETVDMGRSVPSVPQPLAVLGNPVRVLVVAGELTAAVLLWLDG